MMIQMKLFIILIFIKLLVETEEQNKSTIQVHHLQEESREEKQIRQ